MKPAVPDAPLRLGCPEDLAKKLLTDRKYSALNGVREWNSMDWLRGYPGSHIGQVTAGAGLSRGAARSIVERMKDAGVAQKFETDLYLGNRGINAVAQAEAVHVNRVGRRLKVYLKKRANPEVEPPAGGPKKQRPRTYREKQLIHGQGVADLTIALQREGFYVVSGPDMTVNFRQLGVQIKPDLYVKLPPLGDGDATWAALEYERSAVTVKAIVDKLGPYQTLLEAGLHPPLLVVTETEAAAAMFAELGGAYPLMVTTADRALKGPHMTEEGDNLRLGIWGFEASFDQEDPFEYSIEMWKRQLERQLDRLPFAPWTAPWKNPIQYR